MIIALAQLNIEWENKKQNKEKVVSLLDKNFKGTDLLIFPEMTLTGFSMNAPAFSEELDGDSFNFFSELAAGFSVHIIYGIIEKSSTGYFNTLLHINPSGVLTNFYRKIHPFSFSEEDKFYSAGKNPVITEIGEWKTGLSVCYDLRFPELFRLYAKEKAGLIVNIANWPVARIEHWKSLLKARAIENQCYVAGVNRVGNDPAAQYNGCSSIIDPMGQEIVVPSDREEIIISEITKEKVIEVRDKLPFLKDIRLI